MPASEHEMKIFTVDEANALLPRVRKIVSRIQRSHKGVSRYRVAAKKAADAADQGGGGISGGVHYAVVLSELTLALTDLEGLGVQLKDFERGLVDFPSFRDGRVCWTRCLTAAQRLLARARDRIEYRAHQSWS